MLIYKHTSKTTGKSYIGQTTRTMNERWNDHVHIAEKTNRNFMFHNAIRKYGEDDFTHEILEDNIQDKQYLNDREIYWIEYYDTFDNGYNMTPGGEGGFMSKEIRERAGRSISNTLNKEYYDEEQDIWTTSAKERGKKNGIHNSTTMIEYNGEIMSIAKRNGYKSHETQVKSGTLQKKCDKIKETLHKEYYDEEQGIWTTPNKESAKKRKETMSKRTKEEWAEIGKRRLAKEYIPDENGVTISQKRVATYLNTIEEKVEMFGVTYKRKEINSMKSVFGRFKKGKSHRYNIYDENGKLLDDAISAGEMNKKYKCGISKNRIPKHPEWKLVEVFYSDLKEDHFINRVLLFSIPPKLRK